MISQLKQTDQKSTTTAYDFISRHKSAPTNKINQSIGSFKIHAITYENECDTYYDTYRHPQIK